MNIKIFYDNVNFRLKESKKIRILIEKIIRKEGKYSENLLFIFTDNSKILEINREFLNHNWFTDVISFDYSEEKYNIKGEIYISIETVKINANNYKVSLKSEVLRVMVHGTLHLCGYEDSNERLKILMRREEDQWIEELKRI